MTSTVVLGYEVHAFKSVSGSVHAGNGILELVSETGGRVTNGRTILRRK